MNVTKRTGWDAAIYIIEKLRANGHQALLAGGCVRDILLKCTPRDYDVATDAAPDRVDEIFPHPHHVGAKFGVMLVRKYGYVIEVTTFRSDGLYSDGRHPDEVMFGTDVEDARRRDFTINGMFLDPVDDRVIDHVNGRDDLQAGIIRTIGNPDQRFTEDHLRMIRAIRFAARLGFQIDSETAGAIKRLAPHLERISPERIWMELEQILTAPSRAVGWSLLVSTGLREHLIPGWHAQPLTDAIALRRFENLSDCEISSPLAMASAFVQDSPDAVEQWCRALRLSYRQCNDIVWLVRSLPSVRNESSLELAELKTLMARAHWSDLLDLLRVDLIAHDEGLYGYEKIDRRASAIPKQAVAPPPLLSGDELGDMGLQPGPAFGEILKAVYRAQLNEIITTKKQAEVMAGDLMKKMGRG